MHKILAAILTLATTAQAQFQIQDSNSTASLRGIHSIGTPQDQPDAHRNWNALSLPFVVGPKGRIGKLHPEALKP
jgi:hypothetical protein